MIGKRFDKIKVYLSYEIMDNINKKQLDVDETVDLLNELSEENEQLKSICQDHKDHAIDFKANCVRLEKENKQLKAQLKDCEKRVSDKEVEWLRNNTVWEQMPSNKRTFITTIYHRRNGE